ncbi:MAG: 50S ribosomal protein L10 [Candidatus Omnitrophica bacterium]|nr:50S ribosomal protein L10 [Candidatus Omnitrophota bacterium]
MKKVSEIFKEISDRQLKEDLNINSGLFLFKYTGVSSVDLTHLRKDLRNVGARMFVTKNNFINVALKLINKGKDISGFVDGPIALVFVKDDPVGPSKVLTDFAKNNKTIELKGGYIKDRVVHSQDFKMLASIPPRQVLYQQIAMAFNGPISKLALSLNQIVAKLAYALKALSDKKKEEKNKEIS